MLKQNNKTHKRKGKKKLITQNSRPNLQVESRLQTFTKDKYSNSHASPKSKFSRLITCSAQKTTPKSIPSLSRVPLEEVIDVNRIECLQHTAVIFNKVVNPNAPKGTKPYE